MSLLPARARLRTGTRVSERDAGLLQVGLHQDCRLVLPDDADVRRLLLLLGHGVDPRSMPPGHQSLCRRLSEVGLLEPVDEPEVRGRLRAAARIRVDAPEPLRAAAARMLAVAGLPESPPRSRETTRLVVVSGAEPPRARLDRAMQEDLPHLLVVAVAGRVRVGPCVVPGLTACQRCVDEHLTDRDPRHPLVVEQHLEPDPEDVVPPADLQLALAWAVRDLVALVEGGRPTTWSATVDLRPEGPVTHPWRRHPRCGCAWGDALAG